MSISWQDFCSSISELSVLFDRKWPKDPVLPNVSSYPKLRALLDILRLEHDTAQDKLSSSVLHGLTLALFIVPSFVEKNFHIVLPDTLEIIIFLFIGVVLYFKPNGLLGKGIDIGL